MLDSLHQQGFTIELIDPLGDETSAYENAPTNPNDLNDWMAQRDAHIALRDSLMDKSIFTASETHQGGVIFLGGFMHKSLVQLLSSRRSTTFDPKFLIVSDGQTIQWPSTQPHSQQSVWQQIPDPVFRENFYGQNVTYISNPEQYSADMLINCCGLVNKRPLTECYLGALLSYRLNEQRFSFEMDANNVISATASFHNDDDALAMKLTIDQRLPGLYYRFTRREGVRSIEVNGLNLRD